MSNNNTLLPPDATQGAWEFVNTSERIGIYGGIFAGCFIFYAASLFITHWFFSSCDRFCSDYIRNIYNNLKVYEKADWCSRVNSTTHAIIVVIGFPWAMAQTSWSGWPFILAEDDYATHLRGLFAMSCAYFAVDTFVVVGFRVPLWGVFLAHHIAAGIPLFNNIFNKDANCRRATFDLGLFLLVEACTFFVNTQSWIETCKLKKEYRKTYIASIYGTFISWIPMRLVIPMFIMVHLYKTVVLQDEIFTGCMIAPIAAAHFIFIFCYAAFFGMFFPAMLKRWRGIGKLPEDMDSDDEEAEKEKERKEKEERRMKNSSEPALDDSSDIDKDENAIDRSEPFLDSSNKLTDSPATGNKPLSSTEDTPLVDVNNETDEGKVNRRNSLKKRQNPLEEKSYSGAAIKVDNIGFENDDDDAEGTRQQQQKRKMGRSGSLSQDMGAVVEEFTEKIKEVFEETMDAVEEGLKTAAKSGHM